MLLCPTSCVYLYENGSIVQSEPMSNARVLIADDQPDLREPIIDRLDMDGIVAIGANDGVEALELLAKNPGVAVLLSDIKMPRMGGYDLALEATRLYPHLKVMLMTGFQEDAIPAALMRSRQIRTLFKPFALNGLAGLVKQMLVSPD